MFNPWMFVEVPKKQLRMFVEVPIIHMCADPMAMPVGVETATCPAPVKQLLQVVIQASVLALTERGRSAAEKEAQVDPAASAVTRKRKGRGHQKSLPTARSSRRARRFCGKRCCDVPGIERSQDCNQSRHVART